MSEFSGSAPDPNRGNMKNDQIFCNAVAVDLLGLWIECRLSVSIVDYFALKCPFYQF